VSGLNDKKMRMGFIKSISNKVSPLETNILEFLRVGYFIPFLNEHHQNINDEQVASLALAIYRWGIWLSSFLEPFLSENGNPENIVDIIFRNAEVNIEAEFTFTDDEKLIVKGRPDGLLYDPSTNEPIVFELKGLRTSDITRDLTQTTLYAWLVYKQTKILPKVVVLYLEEEDPAVNYSSDITENAIQKLPGLFSVARDVCNSILPVPPSVDRLLCKQCPFSHICDDDFGSKNIKEIVVTNKLPQENNEGVSIEPICLNNGSENEGKQYLENLVNCYNKFKLPVKPLGFVVGPRFIRLKIVPDIERNVSVNKLSNKAEDLQVALGLNSPPLIQPKSGYVSVDIPRRNCQPLLLSELLKTGEVNKPFSDVIFPLGVGIDGSVFWVDLAEPTMTSILISGTSGSGKSVLLRSIVLGLALSVPLGRVSFTLIDPKRVTFTDLIDLPCLDGLILMDYDPVISRLGSLVDEMECRYRLFETEKVHDIKEWNKISVEPLIERIIIIDEYADLIIDKKTKESLETAIQRIGQKGRAAGFHLILATQRPDAKVVTGLIKANLQLKVALKVTSMANSRIILDEGGAEYLIGHGDMLVGGSIGIERLQGPYVTKTDIERVFLKYAAS